MPAAGGGGVAPPCQPCANPRQPFPIGDPPRPRRPWATAPPPESTGETGIRRRVELRRRGVVPGCHFATGPAVAGALGWWVWATDDDLRLFQAVPGTDGVGNRFEV